MAGWERRDHPGTTGEYDYLKKEPETTGFTLSSTQRIKRSSNREEEMQFYLAWTWKVLLMPQASEAWKPLQKNCS